MNVFVQFLSSRTLIPSMYLCEKCFHIRFSFPGAWIDEGPLLRTLKIYFRRLLTQEAFDNTLFYVQHPTLRALLESSEAGCHGCTLIWHFAFKPSQESLSLDAKHPVILFYPLSPGENGLTAWTPRNGSPLRIARGGKEFPSLRFLRLTGELSSHTLELLVDKCGIKEGMTKMLEQNISTPPSRIPSLDLAKKWVADCLILDPQCFQQDVPPMPARLIDVGPQDGSKDPCLKTIREYPAAARYLTLSHCWGRGNHFCTTSKNFEQHKSGIPLNSLPRTFQDAILVAREFGVRYIWIDSLCIIQDSPDDWEDQSRFMGEIYSNAFFTIAAARSSDGHGGLFPDVDPKLLTPCYFPALTFAPVGRTHLINLLKDEKTMTDTPKGPLYERAWVLQEEILSRATLSFTDDGMYWLCGGGTPNVADPGGGRLRYPTLQSLPLRDFIMAYKHMRRATWRPEDVNLAPDSATHAAVLQKASWALRIDDQQREDIYQAWTRMVEMFYRRGISYPTDRLPALAGISPNLQPILYNRDTKTNSFYVGGLWTEDLERSLLWTIGSDKWIRDHLNDNDIHDSEPITADYRGRYKPPYNYMAPSFSWASMHECPITWNGLNGKDWTAGPGRRTWLEFWSYKIATKLDFNSRLEYGSITVWCYLKPVTIFRSQILHDLSAGKDRIGRCAFDDESDTRRFTGIEDGQTWLLPVRNEPVILREEINVYCLLVGKTALPVGGETDGDQKGGVQCRRLGLGYVKYPNWFGDCEPTLVELV